MLAAKVRHDSWLHLGAALIVEGDAALGRPRQVRHDEADVRIKLGRAPNGRTSRTMPRQQHRVECINSDLV